MLIGKSTKLRRLEPGDSDVIVGYWNDYELRQYLAGPLPSSRTDVEDMILSGLVIRGGIDSCRTSECSRKMDQALPHNPGPGRYQRPSLFT